jgi:hypothetical protein
MISWLENLFTNQGWSRDDLKWKIGMIGAVIVGIAALNETSIKLLGLPDAILPWLPWFRLGAMIIGIVSGKMATSGLFDKTVVAKKDDQAAQAGASSLPMIWALFVVSAGLTLLSACAYSTAHQAALHPKLSPLGDIVASVNQVDDDAIIVQVRVIAFATTACGANRTPTCPEARAAQPIVRATVLIGDASHAIGKAYGVYLQTTDAVQQAKQRDDLLGLITDLERQAQAINFAAVSSEIQTLKTDATKLAASLRGPLQQKGQ